VASLRNNLVLALVVSVGVPACAAILGIESLEASGGGTGGSKGDGAVDDGGEAGGAPGAGATPAGGSGSGGRASGGTGGTGGKTGSGGRESGGSSGSGTGGTGHAGSDNDGGQAGAPDGGSQPTTITVTGRLIDRWRHPYPKVPVFIGDANAVTATDGTFTIPNVTPPYSVDFVVTARNGQAEGWSFQDLTRSDPTLQPDVELRPYIYAASFAVTLENRALPVPMDTKFGVVWSSPDGIWSTQSFFFRSNPYSDSGLRWVGPSTSGGNTGVLIWTVDGAGLPAAYNGYARAATSLKGNARGSISLDGTSRSIPSGTLSGNFVQRSLTKDAVVHAAVVLPGSVPVEVIATSVSGSTFSYQMPKITGATVTMWLEGGDYFKGPWGVVHKRGLAPDQSDVQLELADAPDLLSPVGMASVSYATEYLWSGPDVAYVFNASFNTTVADEYVTFHVVTSKKSARVPRFADAASFTIPPGQPGVWWVKIEGPYPSTNEATGPKGFLDAADDFTDDITLYGIDDRDGVKMTSAYRPVTSTGSP
jgi:hypothetical protein